MKLTKELALQMIEEYRGKTKSDRWIDHCICVGDTAGKIAKALTEKGYNVDIDKTITLGYLHDIGKYTGESHGHEISGYNYLKDKGYNTISTDYYNWINMCESWWKNDVDFHKYHDQTGKERKLYTLGMAKRIAEEFTSKGYYVETFKADVSKREEVKELILEY